jgi:hypothetical protein
MRVDMGAKSFNIKEIDIEWNPAWSLVASVPEVPTKKGNQIIIKESPSGPVLGFLICILALTSFCIIILHPIGVLVFVCSTAGCLRIKLASRWITRISPVPLFCCASKAGIDSIQIYFYIFPHYPSPRT